MLVSRTQTLVFGASVEHSVAPQRVPYTVTCCPGALLVPAQGGLAGSSRSSTPWGPGSPPPGVCLRWFFKKLLGCLEHCTKKKSGPQERERLFVVKNFLGAKDSVCPGQ